MENCTFSPRISNPSQVQYEFEQRYKSPLSSRNIRNTKDWKPPKTKTGLDSSDQQSEQFQSGFQTTRVGNQQTLAIKRDLVLKKELEEAELTFKPKLVSR